MRLPLSIFMNSYIIFTNKFRKVLKRFSYWSLDVLGQKVRPLTEVNPIIPQNVKKVEPLKILVAEDNGTFRKLMCAMIERITGVEPEYASDGEEALNKVIEESFDLVFMDNHMPNLSGIGCTEEIRKCESVTRQPHIVAVSGSSDHRDIMEFSKAGADTLLPKPFDMSELAQTIENVKLRKC